MQEVSLGGVTPGPLVWADRLTLYCDLSGYAQRHGFVFSLVSIALYLMSLFVILWGVASDVAYHTAFGTGEIDGRPIPLALRR